MTAMQTMMHTNEDYKKGLKITTRITANASNRISLKPRTAKPTVPAISTVTRATSSTDLTKTQTDLRKRGSDVSLPLF